MEVNMEKILDIKNLRVSFRTNDGTVKAVRNINMELHKGETLAVVGESGSGKSVSAKAIMGILAPNSIVESGEIIFDGKDLLKISEEEFHEYRGNKIAMIFQDPMSSLNPIIRIGKQLTEAMILNGKANQKSSKKDFDRLIKLLEENMGVVAKGNSNVSENVNMFKKFTFEGTNLEKEYNNALENAKETIFEIEGIAEDLTKKDSKQVVLELKEMLVKANKSFNEYVVKKSPECDKILSELDAIAKSYSGSGQNASLEKQMSALKNIFQKAVEQLKPDFFAMGYYLTAKTGAVVTGVDIGQLNKTMVDYLNQNFMNEFLKMVKQGMEYSYKKSLEGKKVLISKLKEALPVFEKKDLDKSECKAAAAALDKVIPAAIDYVSIHKDSLLYTFSTSINNGINTYFHGIPVNVKENKRFDKELKKRNAKLAKKKIADNVIPPVIVDLELIKSNLKTATKRLISSCEEQISSNEAIDFEQKAMEMVYFLRDKKSASVYKVSKDMARNRAIKLMDEVGIPNPRERYMQFPFQFSGGMRQRIVIAIGLAANPDILICDEPTTALDVTIQAQILELINKLRKERGISVIFITHDLGVVANMADRIAVMYAGKIVECGSVDEIFYEPAHPYSWALLASMPDLDTKEKLDAIPGTPPNMVRPPIGDAFAARNKYAMQIDFEQEPPMFEITPTHHAATWLLHPNAPKVDPPKIVTDRIKRMKNLEVVGNE